MSTTMTNVDVLQEAYDFSELITSSEVFYDYIEAKKVLEKDREAQTIINNFQKIKESYDEVQRFGKYHPDFQTISKDVREWKRKLDTHPSISTYKKSEDNLHQLLIEVSRILADSVSTQIKVPTGNPFFDQGGCGTGGCGSGGSCGCGGGK